MFTTTNVESAMKRAQFESAKFGGVCAVYYCNKAFEVYNFIANVTNAPKPVAVFLDGDQTKD